VIYHYEQHPFDSYEVPTGPTIGTKLSASRVIEGMIMDIRYAIPGERSILEVYRNYENALKAKGFEALRWTRVQPYRGIEIPRLSGNISRATVISARLSRPQGDAYVMVFVVKDYGIGGPNKVNVRVVTAEAKPMDSKLVTVDAAQMKQAIAR
jgi:hypothetical protein